MLAKNISKQLVCIAESAKDCGGCRVADMVIALLFAEAESGREDISLSLELETGVDESLEAAFAGALADPDGVGYYDVVWIGVDDVTTCIPLPMLSEIAIEVLRNGKPTLIERVMHDRDVEFDEVAQGSLLSELHQMVAAERIAECVDRYIIWEAA